MFAFVFVISAYLAVRTDQPNSKFEESNIRTADPIVMPVLEIPVVQVQIEESETSQKDIIPNNTSINKYC